jgi:hypothetical protein
LKEIGVKGERDKRKSMKWKGEGDDTNIIGKLDGKESLILNLFIVLTNRNISLVVPLDSDKPASQCTL